MNEHEEKTTATFDISGLTQDERDEAERLDLEVCAEMRKETTRL